MFFVPELTDVDGFEVDKVDLEAPETTEEPPSMGKIVLPLADDEIPCPAQVRSLTLFCYVGFSQSRIRKYAFYN